MRALKKLCVVVHLLCTAVVAGSLASLLFGTADLRRGITGLVDERPGYIAFMVIIIVVALGALITAIVVLSERRPPAAVHPAGNPDIEVRLTAIESAARAAAQEEDVMVERVSSRVLGLDAAGAHVTLDLIAFSEVGLESLGKRVQLRVEEACERLLGTSGVTAQIRFLPSKTTMTAKEVSHEQA